LFVCFGQHIDVEDESPDDIGTVVQGLNRAKKKKYEDMIAETVFGFQQAQHEANLLRTALEKVKRTWEDNENVEVPEVPAVSPGFKKAQEMMDKISGSLSRTVINLIGHFEDSLRDAGWDAETVGETAII